MSINSIVDFIQQGHVATIGTISFFTAPILGAVTLVKFRFGSLRLAQGRTKRLYDIMNRKNGGHTASSGALQLATKDMLGVELPGDAIRFALQRDSPLTLLRNIKQAGLLVKFRADEQRFEDARIRPKLSFQHIFHIAMALIVAPYLGLILFGVILKLVDPIAIAVLFTLDLIVMPALTLVALRADAARRLLNANAIYPLPHATRSSPSTPLTDAVKKPRTRRATKTDDHGSPQVGAAESPPTAV